MVTLQTQSMIMAIGRKYASVLQGKIRLRGLFVFGSYAKGAYDDDSDIDIAVIADDFSGDMINDRHFLMKLRRQVDIRIEPHPFLSSDFTDTNPIALEILRTGIKIV